MVENDKMVKINNSAERKVKQKIIQLLNRRSLPKAQQIVPVDTGALQNSLRVGRSSDGNPYLYTDKNYAPNVEFGTVDMPPQPFLRPAIRELK